MELEYWKVFDAGVAEPKSMATERIGFIVRGDGNTKGLLLFDSTYGERP